MKDEEYKPSPQELTTWKAYQKAASNWDKYHPDNSFYQNIFAQFRKHLKMGTVLEVGCGTARDAEMIIKAGYTYIGTDAVGEFIDIAKAKFPDQTFYVSSVHDLPKLDLGKIDAFWASAVLLHLPRKQMSSALKILKNLTSPHSLGMISIQEGAGEILELGNEKTDSEGRLFVYYTDHEFRQLLSKSGFKVLFFQRSQRSDRNNWLRYLVCSRYS